MWSFALASVVMHLSPHRGIVRDVRIVLGGVAPMPWPAREAEATVEGQSMTPDLAREAAERALVRTASIPRNG